MRFITSLVPFQGKTPPQLDIKLGSKTKIGSNKVTLEIFINGEKETLSYHF